MRRIFLALVALALAIVGCAEPEPAKVRESPLPVASPTTEAPSVSAASPESLPPEESDASDGADPAPVDGPSETATTLDPLLPEDPGSVTTSNRSEPPQLDASVMQPGPQEAAAFVRYWIEATNYSFENVDATLLKESSAYWCEMCKDLIGRLENAQALGRSIRGGQRIFDVLGVSDKYADQQIYSVRGDEVVEQSSEEINGPYHILITEGETVETIYIVAFRDGKWLMVERLTVDFAGVF